MKLVDHVVVDEKGNIPGCNGLYAYVLAGNGLFLKAGRPGLQVLMFLVNMDIVGLKPLYSFVHIQEKVPEDRLSTLLIIAQAENDQELLFWFHYERRWTVTVPRQIATAASVVPTDEFDLRGTNALMDLHSHGQMDAFFSSTDNRDEQGFRIYAVLGNVLRQPEIRVRIGVYGHYFEIPADCIFEVPYEIKDLNRNVEL